MLPVESGPSAASAAFALSTLGIANMMITTYGWIANTPRAHITNEREGICSAHRADAGGLSRAPMPVARNSCTLADRRPKKPGFPRLGDRHHRNQHELCIDGRAYGLGTPLSGGLALGDA